MPEKAEAAAKAVLSSRSAAPHDEARVLGADLKARLRERLDEMTWSIEFFLVVQAIGIVATVTLINLLP